MLCLWLLRMLGWLASLHILHIQLVEGGQCPASTTVLMASAAKHTLMSPNYPQEYSNNELCRWELRASKSYEVIRVQVTDLNIRNSATCGADYVVVKDGRNQWSPTIRRWCGYTHSSPPVTSTKGEVLVTFETDNIYTGNGFRMEYWAVPKGKTVYLSVVLTTKNYALIGVFGFIVCSIVITMILIHVIRHHPYLYAKLVKKQSTRVVFLPRHNGVAFRHATASDDNLHRQILKARENLVTPSRTTLLGSTTTLNTPV